jgi:hypothetical protein
MTVFPFRSSGLKADISWLTRVARAYSAERRDQLRTEPRLVLSLNFELTGQQIRKAQALVELGDGEFVIPDWRYEQHIAAGFSAASLSVIIDASYFTPAIGDAVIVWEDEENFTETTVVSLVSNNLTLANGPAVAYGAASVLPALSCVVTDQLSLSTFRNTLTAATLGVTATDYADFTSYFAGDEYDSKFVAPRDILAQAQSGSVVLAQSQIDMGLGPIQPVRVRAINDWFYSLQVSPNTKLALLEAEAIFHKLAGRLNPFWRPTWLPDFILTANAPAAQAFIRVEVVAAGTDIPAIAIGRKDGTTEFFGVLSWSSTATYTQMNLDDFLAADLDIADVLTISTMRLSRLDTDIVSFDFNGAGDASAKATTVGVAA